MKLNLLAILLLVQGFVFAQNKPTLIPYPQEVKWNEGQFELSNNTTLFVEDENFDTNHFINEIKFQTGIVLQLVQNSEEATILFSQTNDIKEEEGYRLAVTENSIQLKAKTTKGIINGSVSLLQLVGSTPEVPAVVIDDAPKFAWRGMMLDVSRHFFDVETIKSYLDLMAHYKMNKFHWHLTEDQGWRIEVKQYPLLTENSAYRTEKDGTRYGGFYTQEQIKEVVAYASKRGIEVIPEIDMPGHMVAALASYPEFSCTGGPFEVQTEWGVHEDVLCAGNERTYEFVQNILDEIMPLFPSKYMHIGGDECPKSRWKECPKCQAKIKTEGLEDEHELQSYFIKRVEKMVNANSKKMTGWDEILEGGLSETATVQLWRDFHDKDAVRKIAEMGNDVIVSPTGMCYFDYDIVTTDVKQVYNYHPVPSDLANEKHHHVLGGECTVWTERIPDNARLDFMIFPRIIAFSEALWVGQKQGFDNFAERLEKEYTYLDSKGVEYGPSSKVLDVEILNHNGQLKVQAQALIEGVTLKYKKPSSEVFVDYNEAIEVKETGKIIIQGFRNGKAYGDPVSSNFVMHLANQANIELSTAPSKPYHKAGVEGLIDGRLGFESKFSDESWIGFNGEGVTATLTFDAPTSISSIQLRAYDEVGSWIMAPKEVEVLYSKDGKKYKSANKFKTDAISSDGDVLIYNWEGLSKAKAIKSIKIIYTNGGPLPKGHMGAGKPAWLFIDEIIIQ
ncbi:beta-N-acetylhexosaminidase [Flammeovirga sp. EKP202]|uniref:beta-N-acetylhexosaminidase n=1 Tax=Flammeovirga sp. EKP202 TaxID=2770592 RepID=UPI00165F5860|nr:beta-N-acetylhexosaminidase [Flammeovirga sp. EKP202]MBD0401308.1 family 20 glycosylhydrolase [Flammeovirga sp. EKP202]